MKKLLLHSLSRLDLFVWFLVIVFFCGSALLFGGNLQLAFIGSGSIIVEMLLIGLTIEIIIESLKDVKGIGTLTGFITNGPEAVCLIVGLVAGDIIFASSTPLGSNFMNPILLFCAAIICSQTAVLIQTHRSYTLLTVFLTAILAGIFFFINVKYYIYWVIFSTIFTLILFIKRPAEPDPDIREAEDETGSKLWLLPSILFLAIAGYFLDPAVSFAAKHSHAPKGVIGFIVLSTLTSWPEFKSTLSLLGRKKHAAAILNITVSNLTNIWLAIAGVAVYLISR